jgi:sulfatase maturation enzyme AslB (radical SAM superfamily)
MDTNDIINQRQCSIPWLHTEINLQNNSVMPCCKYTKSIGRPEDFIKIWSGAEYQKLRTDITKGNIHTGCVKCYVPSSEFSYKDLKNLAYKNQLVADLDSFKFPQAFCISLSNTCTLACRMCHPNSSSKLAELSNKNQFLKTFYNHPSMQNSFDLKKLKGAFVDVRRITITGGEPLIDSTCIELIEMILEESQHLEEITFSSSLITYNKKLIELLRQVKARVTVNISIDGPVSIHEYIRVGFAWNQMLNNINELKDFVEFGVNSTISLLNVGYISELLDAVDSICKSTAINIKYLMTSPVLEKHLHPANLPADIKQYYLSKLQTAKPTVAGSDKLISTAINLLQLDRNELELTKNFLVEFDSVANTDYKLVYPEFANW